jgi:ribosomal protein S18 acetylase RimI-like enzyme
VSSVPAAEPVLPNPATDAPTPEADVLIRRYEARDRAAVRRLCCETGFLGKPIDPVFQDREIFADYLTRYYTDIEPESSFVLEHGGVVKGYLLGSYRPARQQAFNLFNNLHLFARGMAKYPFYNRPTRDFIGWILRNSWREVPKAPRRAAHFHFNILPDAQGLAHSRKLMNSYLDHLRQKKVRQVYGQVVTFESRRGAKVFERYGFQVMERREISKYRNSHPEPVYLTTVLMELR